jgi:hypothetical protein
MSNQAFSKIWVVIIIIFLVAGGILTWQHFNRIETPIPAFIPTPMPTQDETANWKIYKNDEIGIQFKYPGNERIENTTVIDEQIGPIIDRQIGPIYVKAIPIGMTGPYSVNLFLGESESEIEKQKNEKYYKDLFLLIKDYPQNQECNNLDIFIPIFGRSNVGKSCRIVSSSSGVKIITGFYANIHGEPPKVAFFITDTHWVELTVGYYGGESTSFDLNSNSFIQEVQSGKYKNISKQIDIFDQILKTIKIIK